MTTRSPHPCSTRGFCGRNKPSRPFLLHTRRRSAWKQWKWLSANDLWMPSIQKQEWTPQPARNWVFPSKILHVEKVLWLNHGFLEGDDTDSHIDTLARFATPIQLHTSNAPIRRTFTMTLCKKWSVSCNNLQTKTGNHSGWFLFLFLMQFMMKTENACRPPMPIFYLWTKQSFFLFIKWSKMQKLLQP